MDPLGFGLENFDAIGRWRDLDNGKPVDSAGALASGETFRGPAELRKLLLDRKDRFITNLSRQALKFALGRELRYYDEPEVEKIARRVIARGYRPSELVLAIVESYPFQYQGPDVEQARN
jgi:hypothetical protein